MLFKPDPDKTSNHIDHTVKPPSNKNNNIQSILSSYRYIYSNMLLSDLHEFISIPFDIMYNTTKSVRLTLTPQAFRKCKYDFYTGKFDTGYPFNDVYYFCNQNLTSVYNYGSLQWSRRQEDNLVYPHDTSIYIVNGSNANSLCAGSQQPCTLVCPSGSVLDPVSCICVPPVECIPQPSCSPLPIPLELKTIIYGYAYYVDSPRNVPVPGIGNLPATCWGGHGCCRTNFMPIIKHNNVNIVANKSISMNNLHKCSNNGQIPAEGFIPNNSYEKSDTFQFYISDPSILSDSNFYLNCLSPYSCHNGVTMVFLVGETLNGNKVLLFASCILPNEVNAKPIGTIDCDTESDAVLCDPPPPPPPPSSVYCFEKTVSMYDGFKDCIIRTCATQSPVGETGWTQVGGPYVGSCPDCTDDPCDPPYYCFSRTEQPNCPDQDCIVRQCATSVPSGDGWTQESGPYATIEECEGSCSDDPCDPPAPVYCFEKGGDCVTRTCSETAPEEEGWTQIGGPYECGTCEECDNIGNCADYNIWKITDQNNFIYASGNITYDNTYGYLNDFPNPFTPLFYDGAGLKNFNLQVLCAGTTWDLIEQWDGTITLCSDVDNRYPSYNFINYPWAPQGACGTRFNENGDAVCDPQPCLNLTIGTTGDGQAWRDPQPGIGVKFIGSGDWTNLNNWVDANNYGPASSLPDGNSNVSIQGTVSNKPTDFSISVNTLTILNGGVFAASANVNNLYIQAGGLVNGNSNECPGDITIIVNTICEIDGELGGNTPDNYAILDVTSTTNGAIISGNNYGIIIGNVTFNNSGNNGGDINGNVIFNNLSTNHGNILGNVTFNGGSNYQSGFLPYFPGATEDGITGDIIFKNSSAWLSGNITGSVDMKNTSAIGNGIVKGAGNTITFHDNTSIANGGSLDCQGSCIFEDDSSNNGTIYNSTSPNFYGNSINNGFIEADANFYGYSKNQGSVGGTATFTESACNDGGTATTFVPDPPPSC